MPISERMLTARLHSKHLYISVVAVYAPTEATSENDKNEFYQQLSSIQSCHLRMCENISRVIEMLTI